MKRLVWKKTEPPYFSTVPEKAGIYIISTRQETDHAYEVKFVGQADNLRARVMEHWSRKEKNKDLKAHLAENFVMKFNYAEVESRAEREGMLYYMYEIYDPLYNRGSPRGKTTIDCSLPEVRKHK